MKQLDLSRLFSTVRELCGTHLPMRQLIAKLNLQ